jgi:hypothetical protein
MYAVSLRDVLRGFRADRRNVERVRDLVAGAIGGGREVRS